MYESEDGPSFEKFGRGMDAFSALPASSQRAKHRSSRKTARDERKSALIGRTKSSIKKRRRRS
jgi:hypothetical protein